MRNILVAACAGLMLVTGNAWAGPREDAQAAMARCAANRDDRTYLDCLYGAVQPLRASLGLAPALPAQLRLAAQPPLSPSMAPPSAMPVVAPVQRKGLLGGILGGGASGLRMTTYTFDKHGMFTVTLSNGEIWRQAADDISYAHFSPPASSHTVSVAEGGFGSAEMQVDGGATVFQVRRVR